MHKKLTILTNGNYFAKVLLEQLLRDSKGEISGVLIITGDYKGRVGLHALWEVGRRTALPYLLYKIISIIAFKYSSFFFPKKAFDVRSLAKKYNIPCWCYGSVKSPDAVARIQQLNPDILISVSCPQLIGRDILTIPRIGNINVHSSNLPLYAGLAPYYWVLVNAEKETAITAHVMTPKFDKGNVLSQKRLTILPRESAFHLFERLCYLGQEAIAEAINKMLAGNLGTPQDLQRYTYYSNPSMASYFRLRKNGHVLLRCRELFGSIWRVIRVTDTCSISE
jgi:folate-dependent phosphoribosylglycinamide formyltransferase PurN